MFGEQCEHAVVDPAPLPELDCESEVARQLGEELRDGGQLVRREVGTELDQNRPELAAELARAIDNSSMRSSALRSRRSWVIS